MIIADHLENIINEMKENLPDNLFVDFLLSFKEADFAVKERPEFFKNEYANIIKYYRENEGLDDKDQGN